MSTNSRDCNLLLIQQLIHKVVDINCVNLESQLVLGSYWNPIVRRSPDQWTICSGAADRFYLYSCRRRVRVPWQFGDFDFIFSDIATWIENCSKIARLIWAVGLYRGDCMVCLSDFREYWYDYGADANDGRSTAIYFLWGSSMFANLIGIGLLQNVHARQRG